MIEWPIDILRPHHGFTASKRPSTTKGNPSINGITQVAASHAGRWSVMGEGIPLVTPAKINLWRAIEGLAEGQLGQFLLSIIEHHRAPVNESLLGIPHSDDSYFDDGSGYYQRNYIATITGAVALGATQITISFGVQVAPSPGQLFSVGVRLYSITRIVSQTATSVVVKIWPPTREAILSGAAANFDRPRCLCRLASDDEMALAPMTYNRVAMADLSFIEDTGPVLE